MSKHDIDLFFQLMGKLQSYHLTTKQKALMTAALILVPGRLQFSFIDVQKLFNVQKLKLEISKLILKLVPQSTKSF